MGKVVVMDHPLIQHKIGIMRRTDTGSKDFRTLVSEVAMLECYEATRDLELTDVEIETPICKATVKELKGKKLAVVPILRAGLGMVEGMLELIPAAKVGHIGMYRDPERQTKTRCIRYCCRYRHNQCYGSNRCPHRNRHKACHNKKHHHREPCRYQ